MRLVLTHNGETYIANIGYTTSFCRIFQIFIETKHTQRVDRRVHRCSLHHADEKLTGNLTQICSEIGSFAVVQFMKYCSIIIDINGMILLQVLYSEKMCINGSEVYAYFTCTTHSNLPSTLIRSRKISARINSYALSNIIHLCCMRPLTHHTFARHSDALNVWCTSTHENARIRFSLNDII